MAAKRWAPCAAAWCILSFCMATFAVVPQGAGHWVGTWACAPVGEEAKAAVVAQGGPKDSSVTIRNVVHLSLGGKVLRLRISNEYGPTPLAMETVHVALSNGKDAIQSDTDHMVTFSGSPTLTIPAGKTVESDPVKMDLPPFASLAVSMYIPQQKNVKLTYHVRALSTNYIAPGDQAAATALANPREIRTWVFLTGVDVRVSADTAAVVAYGDSITDGMVSTVDANRRWPDDLARRLQANPRTAHLAVLNEGIAGNRILYEQAGPSMLERMDRDVFGQFGVKYLVVFAGINDLHHAVNRPDPTEKEMAPDIIAGIRQIVVRAHAHGIKVFVATITPSGGSQFHNPPSEAIRTAVNTWIRTGDGFDGVFDFDKAARDTINPTVLAKPYDSPDHTHLNDAGYQALADSIDLMKFQ